MQPSSGAATSISGGSPSGPVVGLGGGAVVTGRSVGSVLGRGRGDGDAATRVTGRRGVGRGGWSVGGRERIGVGWGATVLSLSIGLRDILGISRLGPS